MILERHVHGLSDFEWHVGRSGDRECFVADHVFLRSQQENVSDADEEFTKITVFVFFVIFTMVFFVIL